MYAYNIMSVISAKRKKSSLKMETYALGLSFYLNLEILKSRHHFLLRKFSHQKMDDLKDKTHTHTNN
jgi:hypothetical protein